MIDDKPTLGIPAEGLDDISAVRQLMILRTDTLTEEGCKTAATVAIDIALLALYDLSVSRGEPLPATEFGETVMLVRVARALTSSGKSERWHSVYSTPCYLHSAIHCESCFAPAMWEWGDG